MAKGFTLKERQRQVREDAILEAAQELMLEQGYADMSMDDIATRVGISKATLYQHFPSKEELAINVIVRSMRRGEEQIRLMDEALPAIVRLERSVHTAITKREVINLAQIVLPPAVLQHHPLFQEQKARMMAAIETVIDQAKADGDIVRHIPTSVMARMLMTIVREASHGELADSSQYSVAELSAALGEMLFHGIRTKPSTKG